MDKKNNGMFINGIILSSRRKDLLMPYNNMGESQQYYPERKKPGTNECILQDFIYFKNLVETNRIIVTNGSLVVARVGVEWTSKRFGMIIIFCILIVVEVTQTYLFIKTHEYIVLQLVHTHRIHKIDKELFSYSTVMQ